MLLLTRFNKMRLWLKHLLTLALHNVQMNSEQFNKIVYVYKAANVDIHKYLNILPWEATHSEHGSFGCFAITEAPWLNSKQLPTTVFAAAEITLNEITLIMIYHLFGLRKSSDLKSHLDPTEMQNNIFTIIVYQTLKLKISKLYSVMLKHPKYCHFPHKWKAYLCMMKIKQNNNYLSEAKNTNWISSTKCLKVVSLFRYLKLYF